jgi:hypothetical protein
MPSLSISTLQHCRIVAVALIVGGALLNVGEARAAQFSVTRFDDPAPSSCALGDCSLRDAIIAANTLAGPDTIVLPAGNYPMQTLILFEDAAMGGDYDILDDLTILGAGSAITHIYPRDLDRTFDIAKGVKVSMSGLSIENTVANPPNSMFGGGISSGRFGSGDVSQTSLTLLDVTIDNTRGTLDSAINAHGILIADQMLLKFTSQDNLTALTFSGSRLLVTRSQFLNNSAALNVTLPTLGTAQVRDTQFLTGGAENYCGAISLSGDGYAAFDRISVENFFSFGYAVVCITGNSTAYLRNSTLGYNNAAALFVGAFASGAGTTATAEVKNSTIAGGSYPATVQVTEGGVLNLLHTTLTIEGDFTAALNFISGGTANLTNSIIAGACEGPVSVARFGVNIESPGDTCALNSSVDLVSVSDIGLGPLANNGGPTRTRLPQPGSVAIGATAGPGVAYCPRGDQRNYTRAGVCDIGAAEAAGTNDLAFADGFEF